MDEAAATPAVPAIGRRCLTATPVPLPGARFIFGSSVTGAQPALSDGSRIPLFTLGGGEKLQGSRAQVAQRQVMAAHAAEDTSPAYLIQVCVCAAALRSPSVRLSQTLQLTCATFYCGRSRRSRTNQYRSTSHWQSERCSSTKISNSQALARPWQQQWCVYFVSYPVSARKKC